MTDDSLRERKKRATRRRIHEAALDLAVRHGLCGVTVEDIAGAAEVSPRTFFNYFPSKDAAVVGAAPDLPERLRQSLEERPRDEPTLDALRVVLTEHLLASTADPGLRRHKKRLMMTHPELAIAMAGVTRSAQDALAEGVAQRLGLDLDEDPYPRLAVGVAFAAAASALTLRRARGASRDDLRHDLDAVFDLVQEGLPEPRLPAAAVRA